MRPGDVLVLSGDLGAGKTTLTQGLAEGLGIADYVTSPTFTLVNEYSAPADSSGDSSGKDDRVRKLNHIDLYRTSGAIEALDFGLDEYLQGERDGSVTVFEWAERAPDALPDDFLLVVISRPQRSDGDDGRSASLEEIDSESRVFAFWPQGERSARLLEETKFGLSQDGPDRLNRARTSQKE